MNKQQYAEFHKYLAMLIYEYNKKTGAEINKIDNLVWSYKNNTVTITYSESNIWSSDKKNKVMMTLYYDSKENTISSSDGEK